MGGDVVLVGVGPLREQLLPSEKSDFFFKDAKLRFTIKLVIHVRKRGET